MGRSEFRVIFFFLLPALVPGAPSLGIAGNLFANSGQKVGEWLGRDQ